MRLPRATRKPRLVAMFGQSGHLPTWDYAQAQHALESRMWGQGHTWSTGHLVRCAICDPSFEERIIRLFLHYTPVPGMAAHVGEDR